MMTYSKVAVNLE